MRILSCQRILNRGLRVGLCFLAGTSAAIAQQTAKAPSDADIYCSAIATTDPIPGDTYIVSGENSGYRSTFSDGDKIFINRGSDQGAKVGDQFEVVRPVEQRMKVEWFQGQPVLLRAMGTMYQDVGRLQILNVQAKTSTAAVSMTCDQMQRGDIVRPFTPRPAPPLHDFALNPYAAPSGKTMAMVVSTLGFGQMAATGATVFVNLGSTQGVKVGDYFRVFRLQGETHEAAYQAPGMAYKTYGYGAAPVPYTSNSLPRQILGEGIVIRTGPNSSTVLVTAANQEIFDGDYAEVE
jgi:hypothetical protein